MVLVCQICKSERLVRDGDAAGVDTSSSIITELILTGSVLCMGPQISATSPAPTVAPSRRYCVFGCLRMVCAL